MKHPNETNATMLTVGAAQTALDAARAAEDQARVDAQAAESAFASVAPEGAPNAHAKLLVAQARLREASRDVAAAKNQVDEAKRLESLAELAGLAGDLNHVQVRTEIEQLARALEAEKTRHRRARAELEARLNGRHARHVAASARAADIASAANCEPPPAPLPAGIVGALCAVAVYDEAVASGAAPDLESHVRALASSLGVSDCVRGICWLAPTPQRLERERRERLFPLEECRAALLDGSFRVKLDEAVTVIEAERDERIAIARAAKAEIENAKAAAERAAEERALQRYEDGQAAIDRQLEEQRAYLVGHIQ